MSEVEADNLNGVVEFHGHRRHDEMRQCYPTFAIKRPAQKSIAVDNVIRKRNRVSHQP